MSQPKEKIHAPKGLRITKHAADRFQRRYYKKHKILLENPREVARKLLRFAYKVELDSDLQALKAMSHKDQGEFYEHRDGWRFVVVNQKYVVTIEHAEPGLN